MKLSQLSESRLQKIRKNWIFTLNHDGSQWYAEGILTIGLQTFRVKHETVNDLPRHKFFRACLMKMCEIETVKNWLIERAKK